MQMKVPGGCALCSANAVQDIPRGRIIEEYHVSEVDCETWLRFGETTKTVEG